MGQSVAVRFVLTGGNVDFNKDEILETPVPHKQDIQVQENQVMPPLIFPEGDSWIALSINFIEMHSATKAKIDSLIDEEKEMTCYYDYAHAGTDNPLNVIYYPQGRTKVYNYRFGELTAKTIHKLIFLQSS